MRRVIYICLLFLFVSPSSQATQWNSVEGGRVIDGEYTLRCDEGKGWQKCGEKEDKHYLIVYADKKASVGEKGVSFFSYIVKGKMNPGSSKGEEKECSFNSHAWMWGYKMSRVGWDCHDSANGVYVDGYGDAEWVVYSPLLKPQAQAPSGTQGGDRVEFVYESFSSTAPPGIITCSTLQPMVGYSPFKEGVYYNSLETCDDELKHSSVVSKKAASLYSINRSYPKIPYYPTIRIIGTSMNGKKYQPIKLVAAGSSNGINGTIKETRFIFELKQI